MGESTWITFTGVYSFIFGLGFLFLTVGFLFDIDHEVDADADPSHADSLHDHGPSIFSIRVIACFLMGFGLGAHVSNSLFTHEMFSFNKGVIDGLVGMVGGLSIGVIGWWIIKMFMSQQASSNFSNQEFIGVKAPLAISMPERGRSEINVSIKGQLRSLDVISQDGVAIRSGTMVEVIQVNGGVGVVRAVNK